MIFTTDITTSNEYTKARPKRTVLNVTKGLIYKVEFYFPSGPSGLMGIAVFDGLFQVWPSTVGDFFNSDGETIRFDDMYLKDSAPFEFQCYTYNEDDRYDHRCSVRVGLVSSEVFMARFMPTKSYDYLAELLEKMAAEKAELQLVQAELIKETPFEWLTRQEL